MVPHAVGALRMPQHPPAMRRSAALAVSVLWALHNCIGPYLLAHYTWVGRGRSLARAAAGAAALTGGILLAALACLLLLAPAVYDYGQVCRRALAAAGAGAPAGCPKAPRERRGCGARRLWACRAAGCLLCVGAVRGHAHAGAPSHVRSWGSGSAFGASARCIAPGGARAAGAAPLV